MDCGMQVLRWKHAATNSTGWIVGNPKFEDNLDYIMRMYEEYIGLREVKLAQAKVSRNRVTVENFIAVLWHWFRTFGSPAVMLPEPRGISTAGTIMNVRVDSLRRCLHRF